MLLFLFYSCIYIYIYVYLMFTHSHTYTRFSSTHTNRYVSIPVLLNRHMFMLLLSFLSLALCWEIQTPGVAVTGAGQFGERSSFSKIDSPLELLSGQSLDVAFKLPREVTPQMVTLYVPNEKKDVYIPFKVKGRNARCIVPSSSIPTELSGKILKPVILASGNGVEPKYFSTFDFYFTASDADKVQTENSFYTMHALPEIHHIYKPEPKRVFFLFSLLAIVPIDYSFIQVQKYWKQLAGTTPKPTSKQYYPVVAVAYAFEVVFLMYYLYWSIFSVITCSAVLLPLFIITSKKLSQRK